MHDSQSRKGPRAQKVGVIRKAVCHTHKVGFASKTTLSFSTLARISMSSQVSFCSPFLITWPLPHSVTSESSRSPSISTSYLSYCSVIPAFILPHHLHSFEIWWQDTLSAICISGRHPTPLHSSLMQMAWLLFHHIPLCLSPYCCNLHTDQAATMVTWSSIKKLCFSEKLSKINFFPEAAQHGPLIWVYRPVLTRETYLLAISNRFSVPRCVWSQCLWGKTWEVRIQHKLKPL